MDRISFLKESIKNFKSIGSITQSGEALCKKMSSHVNESDRVIVELGAGDGVITKHLLYSMHKDAILLCFEINDIYASKLAEIGDNRLKVIVDSAENLEFHLHKYGFNKADIIISSIPFLVFSDELRDSILSICKSCLNQNGRFIQFHYTLTMRNLYKNIFGKIKMSFVLLNAPPAYVYSCLNTNASNLDSRVSSRT